MSMTEIHPPDNLMVSVWVKRGAMLVNRHCLDPDDPDQIYNFITSLGYEPEDYGITHPLTEMYKEYSRAQLIRELHQARKEIESLMRMF